MLKSHQDGHLQASLQDLVLGTWLQTVKSFDHIPLSMPEKSAIKKNHKCNEFLLIIIHIFSMCRDDSQKTKTKNKTKTIQLIFNANKIL